jgi:hypothetical protein
MHLYPNFKNSVNPLKFKNEFSMTASKHRSSLTANRFRGWTTDMETRNTFGPENTQVVTPAIVASTETALVGQPKNAIATQDYLTRSPITVTFLNVEKNYFCSGLSILLAHYVFN